jgi:hypothetical protein
MPTGNRLRRRVDKRPRPSKPPIHKRKNSKLSSSHKWSPNLLLTALGSSFAAEPANASPDDTPKRLIQGHARFVANRMTRVAPQHVASTRCAVAKGQSPFAVIVGCPDSHVGPEIVFDQGLGESGIAVANSSRTEPQRSTDSSSAR